MIEYAHCIYRVWAADKTLADIQQNEQEFLAICSRLLQYTEQEIRARLSKESWYLQ